MIPNFQLLTQQYRFNPTRVQLSVLRAPAPRHFSLRIVRKRDGSLLKRWWWVHKPYWSEHFWLNTPCSPKWYLPYLMNGELLVILTLNVRGPSYLGLTRSISWLLLSWLLTAPGHQQPWYWLRRIGRFLSYSRKDFNYLCVSMWWNDTKYEYRFMFPLKNLARKGLMMTVLLNADGHHMMDRGVESGILYLYFPWSLTHLTWPTHCSLVVVYYSN